ncbi:ATP-binding protein [Shimia biformata]|uniref:ATP-binding protein n=1 Tax=Shimia biformata TaxID=1294299 RepID=UPI0019513EEF|nr:ATP-binding protein [Shimia biformata]
MTFNWLKRYMPRGLYGRAALILILPVVTLQLLVSVVFIQRHFEGVTEQMSRTVSRELDLFINELYVEGNVSAPRGDIERLARRLGYDITFDVPIEYADSRRWYDFSGLVVIRTLRDLVPTISAVQLPDDRQVVVFANSQMGPVRIEVARERMSASNPHQLLVNMLVFGALMTLIAFVYLRNQLRPITRLAAAAEAFGRGRNVPYTPSGAVEVRAAGNAFLDMRSRIERQIEQRTMMLSGVSHDLRTPLTRLKLGLSLLEDEDREPLERDVEDMQRLLDEFLSFARGATEGEPEMTDPADFVAQIVEDSARAGLPVSIAKIEGQGKMPLHRVGIRRAVENLINNAVRYGERAEVSVRLSDKSLRIRVDDDGPGIPADRRDEALKPFVRLDPARNQDKGSGVGLGMAIAADVARAHGGVLRLGESDTLGGLRADIVIGR